jgi:formate hydrogenlyase subunit 4
MMFMPAFDGGLGYVACVFAAIAILSVVTGIIESVMARFRFLKTPQVLSGLGLIAALSVLIHLCF